MAARKWFLLVGENGKDLTSATSVGVDVEDVDTLRKAVKKECPSDLANVAAADLTVFSNRAEYDAKRSVLLPQSWSPVTAYGNNEENALIVQVPTQRQVAVPMLSQQSFVWKEPKPLVGTTGSKRSEFYTAFASLCGLVNASKCWLIVICAATITQPVDEFLAVSPQWREMLQTTSLERPKINGRDVFDTFNDGNEALTQLLVDDMGGHGRALEELFKVMLRNQGQAFEFIPVMHNVLAAIRQAYPAIVAQMQSMKQAFLAVISRQWVDGNSLFGNLTLDQVISCGLIRLDGTRLQCPFILFMLLETHDIPWNKPATYAPADRLEDLKPWQRWEHFNCKFRALKSQAFAQEEPVLWTDIHHGARFGDGCNRRVIERQLTYALADKRMPTKTEGFQKGRCSCGNDQGKCFLYQSADGSPFGDAFLCLEDATKGFFHEVYQCKCVEGKLSLGVFKHMRSKAAGTDDLFILYCTSQVTADLRMLPNSAFVDATCWEAYYGPFAARARFIKSVPLPCINTSSNVQLEFVEGVDPTYRARIAKKRPFTSSCEDQDSSQGP
ncbi:hypothetical protein PInf_011607 [Phytophthora infestans]|nr:hypothetical protein PInf_011607 [Phytophthora infestans]